MDPYTLNECHHRVLVVDDSVDLVKWLCEDLSRRGFVTDAAFNGLQCLEKVSRTYYQFIILDIMMPGELALSRFIKDYSCYRNSRMHWPLKGLFIRQEGYEVGLDKFLHDNPLCREQLKLSGSNDPVALIDIHASFRNFLEDELFIHFDGFTVSQMIKSAGVFPRWPHIIMFTAGGISPEQDREWALKCGASAYFLKSHYDPQLLRTVRKIDKQDVLL